MKKIFLVLTFFLFSTASLFAEYRLEPVNCTLKKNGHFFAPQEMRLKLMVAKKRQFGLPMPLQPKQPKNAH